MSAGDTVSNGPKTKEGAYLVNADGALLFCKRWEPPAPARALIFIAHGFAEHLGYYEELAQHLCKNSYYVFAHDHVGHGRSEGARAYIEDLNIYVRDVFQHIDYIREKHDHIPLFIIGHSMGGTITIKAAMQRPTFFTGIVLIGPAVTVNPEVATPLKLFLAKVISRIMPQFPVSTLSYDIITRNPAKIEYMKKDNLRFHGGAKAKWAVSMINALQDIHNNLANIHWPFFVLHGEFDKIVDISGSQALYDLARSSDKTMKVYKEAFHNLIIENEDIVGEMTNDIIEWIGKRNNDKTNENGPSIPSGNTKETQENKINHNLPQNVAL